MTAQLEADVAIVGAGLAGLVAARRLLAAGKQPLVVEARERVGGRLLNEEIGDGKVVEVGGQWIGPTQERLAALAAELDVGTFPTHDEGRHLIEMAGKLTSYTGALTDARIGLVRELSRVISPLALADFEQARGRLDRMAREVPLEEPWMASKAVEWDSRTLATWIGRNTRTEGARRPFELATEAVWAAEPADVSPLHVLFYTHSGGGFNTLVGTGGGAQQDRFHGGSQQLALLMAEQLGAERVRLGAPVRRIEHSADGVTVHAADFCHPEGYKSHRQLVVKARRAIVAIPPTLAGRIAYDPPLPARPVSSSTTRRRTDRRESCSASSRGGSRASGAPATRTSGARRSWPATPASSASGQLGPSASSSGSGPRRSGPAAATAA